MNHSGITRAFERNEEYDKGNNQIVKSHQERGRQVFRYSRYGHVMMDYLTEEDGSTTILYASTGINSVADQQMMNAAFRALKTSFYYSRRNGSARIIDLRNLTDDERKSLPAYVKDVEQYLRTF